MNSSGSESQKTPVRSGKDALKANKACVPCRVRKVKCDAAVIGLPCSSCTSRQCVKGCILPVRKNRTRKTIHVPPIHDYTTVTRASTSDSVDCQDPRQTQPDLLYLNILNDTVSTESGRDQPPSSTRSYPNLEDNPTLRNHLWTKLPQLDDTSKAYLTSKGVFNLPSPPYLDALVKTYLDHVYPFAPVINRASFTREYQSGDCSLFLLYVILATASIHASTDLLLACGFSTSSAAQESFFSHAKLLDYFAAEDDPLLLLQGSIILCGVILDHPSDRDFGYWFHNAVRLATKIDLRDRCIREDKPPKMLKLYRRIWWALYSLDVFHVFINTNRHSRLLADTSTIKLRVEDDSEDEDISEGMSRLLSPATPQQRASPVVHSELSRIFGESLSVVINKPQLDPRHILHPLDAWRKSLAVKLNVGGNTATDVYYLNLQAMSYRLECIFCRQIRRRWQHSRHADWSEWATTRFRSALLELDTIIMRVLVNGTLQNFPIPFVTTIPALLALHIESALDPVETDLVRSMARISISQAMLVLVQGKEIPALKRALPVFEDILARKNLYLVPSTSCGHLPTLSQAQNPPIADVYALSNTQVSADLSETEQSGNNLPFYGDFLGLDFLDDWRLGSWISPVDIDMVPEERAE